VTDMDPLDDAPLIIPNDAATRAAMRREREEWLAQEVKRVCGSMMPCDTVRIDTPSPYVLIVMPERE